MPAISGCSSLVALPSVFPPDAISAEEFGKAFVGNRQQKRQLVVFDNVTGPLAAKRAEPNLMA